MYEERNGTNFQNKMGTERILRNGTDMFRERNGFHGTERIFVMERNGLFGTERIILWNETVGNGTVSWLVGNQIRNGPDQPKPDARPDGFVHGFVHGTERNEFYGTDLFMERNGTYLNGTEYFWNGTERNGTVHP